MSESIKRRRRDFQDLRGKEIFEKTPIILGGNPTDPANKLILSRDAHIKVVVFWNKVIREQRKKVNSK